MRILVLTNIFPTTRRPMGGSYVRERVAAHRAAGHTVDVVALRMKPRFALRTLLRRTGRDDESGEVQGMLTADYSMGLVPYLARRRATDSTALATRVADQVEQQVDVASYDVIHAHGMYRPPAGVVAHLLSERHGIPFVVTAHGTDINVGMAQRTDEFRRTFEAATAVMYVSRQLMARAQDMGAPTSGAHHVPNGVDLDEFRLGQEARDEEILFVGNLAPVKGADRLPEIFDQVLQAHPRARLTVIGVGQLADELRSSLPEGSVIFRGQQPRAEVAAAMGRARVLLVPSRSEGWPCVILEAQATGTPVVATDVGGIKDAVGEGGVVIPHDDEVNGNLAKAVTRYLDHPADGEALRTRAAGFSWDEIARLEREAMGC